MEIQNFVLMANHFLNTIYFHYALVAITSIAIGVVVIVIANYLFDFTSNAVNLGRSKLSRKITAIRSRPPAHIQRALGMQQEKKKVIDLEKIIQRLKWLIPEHLLRSTMFIVSAVFISLIGFSACITYLQNFGAGVMCVIAVILLFAQIFTQSTTKDKEAIKNQLPSVARIFGSVMEDTGNYRLAVDAVAERSPEPSKSLFRKVAQMLDHGIEPEKAFEEIPKAAGSGYPMVLKDLMLDAYRYGTTVLPRFTRLASQVDTMQELHNENSPDVVQARITSILLHIGIIVMAFLTIHLMPDAKKYLVEDQIGKVLVTLSFVSVVVGVIADRLWGDISD